MSHINLEDDEAARRQVCDWLRANGVDIRDYTQAKEPCLTRLDKWVDLAVQCSRCAAEAAQNFRRPVRTS